MTTPKPDEGMNLIQFEGCTVAVLAPEDLEAIETELLKAKEENATLREQVRIARRYIYSCDCTCVAYDEGNTVACSRCNTLKQMEEVK